MAAILSRGRWIKRQARHSGEQITEAINSVITNIYNTLTVSVIKPVQLLFDENNVETLTILK